MKFFDPVSDGKSPLDNRIFSMMLNKEGKENHKRMISRGGLRSSTNRQSYISGTRGTVVDDSKIGNSFLSQNSTIDRRLNGSDMGGSVSQTG